MDVEPAISEKLPFISVFGKSNGVKREGINVNMYSIDEILLRKGRSEEARVERESPDEDKCCYCKS